MPLSKIISSSHVYGGDVMNDTFPDKSTPKNSETSKQQFTNWVSECLEGDARWFYKVGYIYEKSFLLRKENLIGITLRRKGKLTELKDVDAEKLLHLINLAGLRIRVAFKDDKKNREFLFKQLCNIASTGLFGKNPAPKIALADFESFKSIVPEAAIDVRKGFLGRTLLINTIFIGLAVAVIMLYLPMHTAVFSDLSAVMDSIANIEEQAKAEKPITEIFLESRAITLARYVFPNWNKADPAKKSRWASLTFKSSSLFLAYSTTTIGVCIGLILISFLRNRKITYNNFDEIYLYRMRPWRYFILIEVLALVLIILVASDVVILGVGSISLNEIDEKWWNGLILGLLCSICEPLISKLVVNQVRPSEIPKQEPAVVQEPVAEPKPVAKND